MDSFDTTFSPYAKSKGEEGKAGGKLQKLLRKHGARAPGMTAHVGGGGGAGVRR